jgi:hypothetical protein
MNKFSSCQLVFYYNLSNINSPLRSMKNIERGIFEGCLHALVLLDVNAVDVVKRCHDSYFNDTRHNNTIKNGPVCCNLS